MPVILVVNKKKKKKLYYYLFLLTLRANTEALAALIEQVKRIEPLLNAAELGWGIEQSDAWTAVESLIDSYDEDYDDDDLDTCRGSLEQPLTAANL